jgi:hypothetical protein
VPLLQLFADAKEEDGSERDGPYEDEKPDHPRPIQPQTLIGAVVPVSRPIAPPVVIILDIAVAPATAPTGQRRSYRNGSRCFKLGWYSRWCGYIIRPS